MQNLCLSPEILTSDVSIGPATYLVDVLCLFVFKFVFKIYSRDAFMYVNMFMQGPMCVPTCGGQRSTLGVSFSVVYLIF